MPRIGTWNLLSAAEKDEIVHLYQSGSSLFSITQELGYSSESIRVYMLRKGLLVRNHRESQQFYSYDETKFKEPLSAEAAYWVGMLLTDGCVNYSGRGDPRIILTLKRSDRGHLAKFLRFLRYDGRIYDKTKINKKTNRVHYTSYVAVRSKKLVDDLAVFGVVPRKSKTCEVHHLEGSKDFWRGALDGDGELNITRKSPRIVFTGSAILTRQFAAFCTFHDVPYPSIVKNGSVFKAQLFGARAVRILELLYPDALVSMDRKMAMYQRIRAAYTNRDARYYPQKQRSLATKEEVDAYLTRVP